VCPKSHKTHIKLKILLGMDEISRQQMLQRKTILHRTPFPMDKGDRLHPIFAVGRVLNHIPPFQQ